MVASNAGRTLVSQTAKVLNSPVAKEFALEVAGVGKIDLEEGADAASKAVDIIKNNPKLLSESKTVSLVIQEVTKIEKAIKETGALQKLLKESKFTQRHDHQWETILSDGNKLIIRRDIGKYAHPIGKKYRNPVNHWNIELHLLDKNSRLANPKFKRYYNYHIILDENLNVIEGFGN